MEGVGPLSHIKVLDLATFLAAPVAVTLLADFGAEVVKVEQPGIGDPNRLRGAEGGPGQQSLLWLQEARNRKSVSIDLRTAEGQDMIHQLVPKFDIIVTNYRPSTLDKWRLDPETLQRLHPDAIILYVSGYGLTGPYSQRGSLDRVASAYSGQTYVSGDPEGPPIRAGNAVIDYMTGYLGAFGAMTALYHRDHNNGPGQIIDLALFEAGFRATEDTMSMYSVHGTVRQRTGNRNTAIVPASDFQTKDGGHVVIHAGTDAMFKRLAKTAMKQPHLLDDPKFSTYAARVANQDELYSLIQDWVGTHDAANVMEALVAADIPSSPVMSVADIAADPHFAARGAIAEFQVPGVGTVQMPSVFPKMSVTPGAIRNLGPELGSSTDEILSTFAGLDATELDKLRRIGVIG